MANSETQVAMANALTRCLINRSDPDGFGVQVTWVSGRTTPDVENFQPQGLHFRLPAKSEGIAAAPSGIADNAVVVGASKRSALPDDALLEGEGGLHYLGEYKVFLKADGSLALGSKDPTDFIALASLVDDAIQNLILAIQAGFTAGGGAGPAYAGGSVQKTAFDALTAAVLPTGSTTIKAE